MHAATQEPNSVETTTFGSALTLYSPWTILNSSVRAQSLYHANLPTTASMAPRNEVTVKGFVT